MSHLIADWLLPIFFALVGVELRNEIKFGAFKKRTDLLLPLGAAIFGVVLPFLTYQIFVSVFSISGSGWGAVIATDLPLALLALKLLGSKMAIKLRPYLLSLAIFDDVISIILIAVVFHKNGIHPTVYGFLVGLLLPLKDTGIIFKIFNFISNYLIIPLFVISVIIENWSLNFGLLTTTIFISRMIGKPIGIYLGNQVVSLILGSKILPNKEVLLIGTIATLGLSVSLLFAQISMAPTIVTTSVILVIPFALFGIWMANRFLLREARQ
jgi:Na+/H+ antiporter NhaA